MLKIADQMEVNLLDTVFDPFIRVDSDFKITYMNQAAKKHFGLTVSSDLKIDIFIEKMLDSMTKKMDNNHIIHEIELEIIPNKRKFYQVHCSSTDNGYSLFFTDVSKEKQIEKEIEEKYKQLVLLEETSDQIIFHQEPNELLDSLFETLSQHLNLDVYFNYIYKQGEESLHLLNFKGIDKRTAKEIETLQLGIAVCGSVALNKELMIVERVNESIDPRVELIKSLGIKSYICHPLISYGKLIGTLSFGSKTRSSFTTEEMKLIEKITKRVGRKLERTLLMNDLKQKNLQLIENNQKLMESERKLLLERGKAEVASRAKSNFLMLISHELRTPLNNVLGYSQVLEDDKNLTEVQKRMINEIQLSSRQLKELIDTVLDYVKLEESTGHKNKGKENISEGIENVLKNYSDAIQAKNIQIHVDIPKSVVVNLERFKLIKLVSIITSNAIKYNIDNGQIFFGLRETNKEIELIVEDTGIGIEKSDLVKIYQPFFRAKEVENLIEGIGIGLTVVKKMLDEINGRITISSEYGKGTKVTLFLPKLKE